MGKYAARATPGLVASVVDWWEVHPDATLKECAGVFGLCVFTARAWLLREGKRTDRDRRRHTRKATGPLTVRQAFRVRRNLGLVFAVAEKILKREVDGDRVYGYWDAVADGFVGLCKASQLFDSARGTKFSTYAGVFVSREMAKCYGIWVRKTYRPHGHPPHHLHRDAWAADDNREGRRRCSA